MNEYILVREWNTGYPDNKELKDRNGDGRIDYLACGMDRYTDGFGIYKEDNDFDGYFERQYEFGGYAGVTNYDRRIHEKVPAIPSVFAPTKIIKVPRTSSEAKP